MMEKTTPRDREALKRRFKQDLRNKFSVLEKQQELNIEAFNEMVLETGEKILGPKRKKKEEWISQETWKK